ncbi:uncharacterized protein [Amphiura filiformis]|uniref:uncharacterized protein n=1 Tax=Amphiura filiformis TaxID=82378 RepID=UPI003B212502
MRQRLETEIADEQGGFRAETGTWDQFVNIRNIIEKCRGHSIPLYLCFIDYSKAFDGQSSRLLEHRGGNGILRSRDDSLLESGIFSQDEYRGESELFQGCILSPALQLLC